MTRDELLESFANEPDEKVRAAVVRQLGAGKDPLAVTVLTIALKDNAEAIQLAAAVALGQIGSQEAREPLWSAVGDPTKGPRVRQAAAVSLAKLGDVRAVDPLIQALPSSDAYNALLEMKQLALPGLTEALGAAATRKRASTVLIAEGKPAIDSLIPLARNPENKNARLAAVRVLSEMEDERIPAVMDEVLKSSDPEVTLAASRYLIRAGRASDQARLLAALKEMGNNELAQDFYSSNNPALKAAAEEWAGKRSAVINVRTAELAPVFWGGVDPSIKDVAVFHFDGALGSAAGMNPLESKAVSFVPGKFGQAVSLDKGGVLKYPAASLPLDSGSIEMWISPKIDGADPILTKYNHALLLYPAPDKGQFLISGSTAGGFYCGTVVGGKFTGAGGGSITDWKAGSWHHLAFTYSTGHARQRFYLDGAMVSETTAPMGAAKAGGPAFHLISDPYGNWTEFNLDELVIATGEKGSDWIQRDASRKNP